ncbi:hypothetical protein LBMAG33_1010 [Candidatus Levyibacteriota bacterium]|nr:hypothetical protein LBMAG33_1010 [Candidatus Levybacteria bacterium]
MNKYIGFIIVLILSFWAVKSLFLPGFFPMHDDTQPSRIFEMAKSLSIGQIPVRFVSDLGYGYGYPIFNFYAPLAYYIGALFLLLGATAITAAKIIIIIPILLSGVFMYILGKEFFGKYGGIISAISYMYAPYNAINIYVRGDIAELWAYSFIPIVFYSAWKIASSESSRYVILGAFTYALLILSHNLTALMASGFLIIFVIFLITIPFQEKQKERVIRLCYFLILGISLSAFYWIPAIAEINYTNVISQVGGGADFRDHFVCINQLWNSPWGFGGSTIGCIDGMSFKIGKISIIFAGFAILLIASFILRKMSDYLYVINVRGFIFIGAIFGFLLSVFFTIEASKPIWEIIPIMAFFQYPWRFLIFVAFFSSILSGYSVWLITNSVFIEYHSKHFVYITTVVVVWLIIISNQMLFIPNRLVNKQDSEYISKQKLNWNISKISDEYMPKYFEKPNRVIDIPSSSIELLSNNGNIISVMEDVGFVSARVNFKNSGEIRINKAYFPTWHIFIDGKEVKYSQTKKGLVVSVTSGEHIVEARYAQTLVQIIANTISLAGLLAMAINLIYNVKKIK